MSALDELLENNNWRIDEVTDLIQHQLGCDRDLFIWDGEGVPPIEQSRAELAQLRAENAEMREALNIAIAELATLLYQSEYKDDPACNAIRAVLEKYPEKYPKEKG